MNSKNNLAIPLAIVVAGALIAGALFLSGSKAQNNQNVATNTESNLEIRGIDKTDHVLGNPNAPVIVYEYSDLECPYCSSFHTSMKAIMDEYGKDGKVAWVYRHYWAERRTQDGQIFHPHGGKAAEASECVAELGGAEKFWQFAEEVFAGQPDSLNNLNTIAQKIGVEKTAFDSCLSSGKYADKVQKLYDEGNTYGVTGTPNSFIVTKSGVYPVEGAVPYAQLKQMIDLAVKE